MRNLVVQEALQQLALEASERLAGAVASGDEVAFELVEQPGGSSPLYCYRPLTERYVRERADAIRGLDSYGAACAAIASAGAAEPYLAALGAPMPADPRAPVAEAILIFLCRLWADSAGFSLEGDRFERCFREWESAVDEQPGSIEVIVPIAGLRLPVERLALGGGLALVRSDTVEVPADARRPEGQARTAWEPQILAWVCFAGEQVTGPAPVTAGQFAIRSLITALRLFKPGSVGLSPHAWTRAAEGPWRRLVTGAGRPRGGGYWLTEAELGELAAFAAALSARPLRGGSLAWAVARFEMGAERRTSLEGLSDHLLALRALLEGGGAQVGMAARVAALCAEPGERQAVQALVERALAIERSMMRGLATGLGEGPGGPVDELLGEIEDHLRAILRDAVTGHLGPDLRATADEILRADGISFAEAAGEQAVEREPEPVLVGAATAAAGEDWMADSPYAEQTLEWPSRPAAEAEPSPERFVRGRHLFPVPDTTDWPVGELRRASRPAFDAETAPFDALPPPPEPGAEAEDDYYSAPI